MHRHGRYEPHGLTLVRNLVELHGGTVEAHSAGLGQGSEFVVRLPALIEEPPESPGDHGGDNSGALPPGRRVLVVDDNTDAAGSLATLLQLWGYEAHVAHNGPAALEAARRCIPEIVLLDIGLPGMDGYQVARQLRGLTGLERVLIVAVTGYGQEEDRRRSQEAGFDHHLVKPVDLAVLSALLT